MCSVSRFTVPTHTVFMNDHIDVAAFLTTWSPGVSRAAPALVVFKQETEMPQTGEELAYLEAAKIEPTAANLYDNVTKKQNLYDRITAGDLGYLSANSSHHNPFSHCVFQYTEVYSLY